MLWTVLILILSAFIFLINAVLFSSFAQKEILFLAGITQKQPTSQTVYYAIKQYHCRWRIELFFKWIKQHLRIKAFYGTSENAVKTQIWIAVSTYLLVAIAKKMLKIELSLYTIL